MGDAILTRLSAFLVLVSLGTALLVVARTDGSTAIMFSFLGQPALALGIVLYAWAQLRPVRMTEDERRLYHIAFESLRPRDFLDLVVLGHWDRAAEGEVLVRRGEHPKQVQVMLEGSVAFRVDDAEVGRIGPGQLVGITAVVGETPIWGDAVVVEDARYLSWPVDVLRRVLEKRPELRIATQGIVARDLAEKLKRVTGGAETPVDAP